MPLPGWPERPVVRQDFTSQNLVVGTTPTPLNSDQALAQSYIDSFIIAVPSTAANSVFMGNQAVTAAANGGGVEIVAGAMPNFRIEQGGRMLYEILRPLLEMSAVAGCKIERPDVLPFVCWDLSTIFLIATANTNVTVMFFRNPFV